MSDDASLQGLTDTSKIREWRSIVTLVVFILTNVNVLFPFHIPIYVPRKFCNAVLDVLSYGRIIAPRLDRGLPESGHDEDSRGKKKPFIRLNFPMNFVTAPLVADLFLLAILAIGRQEVHDGTIGANHIEPIDIMVFFITLAYIAISIDASGLIRFLAFKVLQLGGKVGHRLFFYLYVFFFGLGTCIGNDPIILSGTAFLAYMTRVSSNIVHPRAWIHTQFAIANIASAILVSSNPTNLVLAGAFNIKFIVYTANMIVPVLVTAVVLFPFLLYVVFADEALIPYSIKMHELPEESKAKKPVNPNIPNARRHIDEDEADLANDENGKLLSLEEIMNPFLDKGGAAFGGVIMAATLVTVIALNAASQKTGAHPVFWVTLPAAVVVFCWDLGFGWYHREETRQIARHGMQAVQGAREERVDREEVVRCSSFEATNPEISTQCALVENVVREPSAGLDKMHSSHEDTEHVGAGRLGDKTPSSSSTRLPPAILVSESTNEEKLGNMMRGSLRTKISSNPAPLDSEPLSTGQHEPSSSDDNLEAMYQVSHSLENGIFISASQEKCNSHNRPTDSTLSSHQPTTLVSLASVTFRWCQETFPTATAVVVHLPFALVPFAFSMFVLVQALATKGWIPVFAYGWDHWVNKTGTVGSIAGMGFLSVVLCNFAGTNIGTTILLSRVIQSWLAIHEENGIPISERTFWATVYSMALGVNYGAFSTAFSASLAGLLWRDILARKHIRVRGLDFARVNLPIIAIAMVVGCVTLVGQVYIVRHDKPYKGRIT